MAEFLGTLFLVCGVVGSGIMAVELSDGNDAVALLANSLATGAILVTLIYTFAPISGAHFNPAVTLAALIERSVSERRAASYVLAQFAGAVSGTMTAHLMFGLDVVTIASKNRGEWRLALSEFIATFGLVLVVHGTGRRVSVVPLTVAAYITAAYWFTSSTSFANPAVTVARTLTDTFTAIRPEDAPWFIAAQVIAAVVATYAYRALREE